MPDLKFKFDRHGLGDVVHFAHVVQLYKRHGYDVTVQVEENKKFVWQVAGVNIVQGRDLPDHEYGYPGGFEDLNVPDHDASKIAHGMRHSCLPSLESLGLTPEQAWDELCQVRLDAKPHVSAEDYAAADKFLEGMPRPIICLHSRGTNWHERKSIPTDIAFETILKLLDQTAGSVIVLDFDRRAPMVGDARCKGIKPSWGHISVAEQCALLERSDLLIGIDSGPFHVASMTKVKSLGVFRSLHPVRVCLPNPNAVYLVSSSLGDQWEKRTDKWNFLSYAGKEPAADDISSAAVHMLNGVDVGQVSGRLKQFAGRYVYRRVGFDERIIQLLPDGSIGEGKDGCEQRWSADTEDGADIISISGKEGIICRCKAVNGVYRGRWTKFEQMAIELHPGGSIRIPVAQVTIAGTYRYQRIGIDVRTIELRPDGTILGAGDCERHWSFVDGRIYIIGKHNVICSLQKTEEGTWAGRWTQFEKMAVTLSPVDEGKPQSNGLMWMAILLTTWNRPELLERSLSMIQQECADINEPLFISDDRSDDPKTIGILSHAEACGATLWRRAYERSPTDDPHILTQENNLFAFERLLRENPHFTHVLKVDDDIELKPGAFRRMKQIWMDAEQEFGSALETVSGLRTTNESVMEERDGYSIVNGGCNAAIIYRADTLRKSLLEADRNVVLTEGFDCHLTRILNGAIFCAARPSVVKHAGAFGVHTDGFDINIDYQEQ